MTGSIVSRQGYNGEWLMISDFLMEKFLLHGRQTMWKLLKEHLVPHKDLICCKIAEIPG